VIHTLNELKKNCRRVGMTEAKRYRSAKYYFAWLVMQVAG
jgi:hypothetical protein